MATEKKTNLRNINEITSSVIQLHEQIDELAREYDHLPPDIRAEKKSPTKSQHWDSVLRDLKGTVSRVAVGKIIQLSQSVM